MTDRGTYSIHMTDRGTYLIHMTGRGTYSIHMTGKGTHSIYTTGRGIYSIHTTGKFIRRKGTYSIHTTGRFMRRLNTEDRKRFWTNIYGRFNRLRYYFWQMLRTQMLFVADVMWHYVVKFFLCFLVVSTILSQITSS